MKVSFFVITLLFVIAFSAIFVHDADAASKSVIITQKCENIALHVFITNQDGKPIKNAKIFDGFRMEVLVTADESGFAIVPGDLQGDNLRAGGGSYVPTSFTAENCQPIEIEFEKSDQDIMIVHHHTWSNFDSTQEHGGGEYQYTEYTGNLIVGDIVNLSEHNLTDIRIAITTFGERLGTIESKSWHPMKKILRPGEASPFFAYMGGGFDNYSIKIDNYKGTSEMPVTPQVEISDVFIHKDDNSGVETLIVTCANTSLEKSDNLHLMMLGYSEDNLLQHAAVGESYLLEDRNTDTSNCVTDGKVSIPEFLPDAKIDRFEVFIIQNDVNRFYYDVQEMNQFTNLNAYENVPNYYTQTAVYSNYFPDSLTPNYINIDNLKVYSEKLREIEKSKTDTVNLPNDSDNSIQEIPVWIKNNAGWWANDKIDDDTFVSGVKYLIESQIIVLDDFSSSSISNSTGIPSWIKTIADLWSQEMLTDVEFMNAIKFLVENGVIIIEDHNIDYVTEQQDFVSFRGEKIETFVELRERERLKIIKIISPDNYCSDCTHETDTIFETAKPKGGIVILPFLPFGEYYVELNNFKEKIIVDENGHTSQILQTILDDGMVLCLGMFITLEECQHHKSYESKQPTSTGEKQDCNPSYPDFCIPPPPPDLDCKDIPQKRFTVLQPDPHRFDGDKDGIGCES